MPYTLAHPLFAAPLRRLGLPLSALAAGAVAPDLPLWATSVGLPGHLGSEGYFFTHSLPGIVTADLLIGMILWGIWVQLVRAPFFDSLPSPLRERVPAVAPGPEATSLRRSGRSSPSAPLDAARRWSLAALGVMLGVITHVGIDEFTHPGRWGAQNIPWLAETHAGLLGTSWVQYSAGVGGLLGIALWCGWTVLRSRPLPRPATSQAARRTVQALVLLAMVIAVADAATVATDSLSRAAFVAATRGVMTVLAGLLLGSAISAAVEGLRPSRPR